jgi:serine/threonine-protein kinase
VLHLDIKPTNIMIEHSGAIKLCDFGMAMLASAAGYGGARGGTVGYMPPEQIEGDLVDERADIFSLAVVVWQALTGQNPFAAKTAEESLRKIGRGPKVALSKLDPTLAGMAEEVIMQALDPNPTQRIPSAEAFANELVFGLGDPDLGAESIKELMSQDEKDVATAGRRVQARGAARCLSLPLAWRRRRARWGCGAFRLGGVHGAAGIVSCAELRHRGACRSRRWRRVAAGGLCARVGGVRVFALRQRLHRRVHPAAARVRRPVPGMVDPHWHERASVHVRRSSPLRPWPAVWRGGVSRRSASRPPGPRQPREQGFAWQLAFGAARQVGFGADAVAAALVARLARPGTWLLLAGSCLGALVASLLYRSGRLKSSVASGVAGQVVGTAILIASQFMAVRVENGGIWTSPKFADVAVAILLCVFVCIATNLRGPLDAGGEVEEIDEFA